MNKILRSSPSRNNPVLSRAPCGSVRFPQRRGRLISTNHLRRGVVAIVTFVALALLQAPPASADVVMPSGGSATAYFTCDDTNNQLSYGVSIYPDAGRTQQTVAFRFYSKDVPAGRAGWSAWQVGITSTLPRTPYRYWSITNVPEGPLQSIYVEYGWLTSAGCRCIRASGSTGICNSVGIMVGGTATLHIAIFRSCSPRSRSLVGMTAPVWLYGYAARVKKRGRRRGADPAAEQFLTTLSSGEEAAGVERPTYVRTDAGRCRRHWRTTLTGCGALGGRGWRAAFDPTLATEYQRAAGAGRAGQAGFGAEPPATS